MKKLFVFDLAILFVLAGAIAAYWWHWSAQWDAAMHASVMSGAQ